MSRRQRAIEILTKYQAALADKLTELVINQEEQLMSEAEGPDLGFTNDLYDLAEKLRAVAVTLSVIPGQQRKPVSDYQNSNLIVVSTSLPTITISDFLTLVDNGDFDRAAAVLAHIFGITLQRAVKCTDHFVRNLEADTKTLDKVFLLAQELHRSMNQTLVLMRDLFGLLPGEAQQVVHRLKS